MRRSSPVEQLGNRPGLKGQQGRPLRRHPARDQVRVRYHTRNAVGQILLLLIYAKSVRASIPGAVLKQIKEVLEHAD